jgi:hypothetical protein
MSLAATIMARLGLDTQPFSDGMRTANAAVDQHARYINRATGAHGNLLKSSARVGHQISNVARDMFSGADATTIFSSALEGLGRSFKLGLGAIAGLFVGGMIVAEIGKAAKAAEKLHQEVVALIMDRPNARFESLNELISKLETLRKKYDEVAKMERKAATPFSLEGLVQSLHPSRLKKDAGDLRSSMQQTAEQEAVKARRSNDEREASDSGNDFKAERMKALDELLPKVKKAFFEKNFALAAEELRAYAITLKEINTKMHEASGFTLAQLAEHGSNDPSRLGGKRIRLAGEHQDMGVQEAAQKAIEEKKLWDEERMSGRRPDSREGANYHQGRYEQLTAGLGDLVKPSEQTFKKALAASEAYLSVIKDNTAQHFQHK